MDHIFICIEHTFCWACIFIYFIQLIMVIIIINIWRMEDQTRMCYRLSKLRWIIISSEYLHQFKLVKPSFTILRKDFHLISSLLPSLSSPEFLFTCKSCQWKTMKCEYIYMFEKWMSSHALCACVLLFVIIEFIFRFKFNVKSDWYLRVYKYFVFKN